MYSGRAALMAKKVTLETLGDEIKKILDEYQDDITTNIDIVTKQIGQKGAAALRNQSKATFEGKNYASGWTATTEKTRLYTVVTIHNKRQAGLAHLLEFGHVSANGTGRNYETDKAPVKGREHIAPIEQELVFQYEKEVKAIL